MSVLSVCPAAVQVWLAIVWPAVTQVPDGLHAGAHSGPRLSWNCPFASVTCPQGPLVPQQVPVMLPHVVTYDWRFNWFVDVLHITSPIAIPPTGIAWPDWSFT